MCLEFQTVQNKRLQRRELWEIVSGERRHSQIRTREHHVAKMADSAYNFESDHG